MPDGHGLLLRLRRAPLPGTERRRAALAGVALLAVVGGLDLLLEGFDGRRAAVWVALAAYFSLQGALLRHSTAARVRWVALSGAVAAVAGLLALVKLGGGSQSPLLVALPTVPLLQVAAEPEELGSAALGGTLMALGGMLLLWSEGASPGRIGSWVAVVAGTTAFSIFGSLRHLERSDRAMEAERERLDALARLSESRQAQARAEHLASVGLVADGVAHEMNGPLASARSNLAYARDELREGRAEEADDALADAEAALERIREVSATLQVLARPEPEGRAMCALAPAAAEAVQLAAARLGQPPAVELALPPGLPFMFAVRRELVDLLFHMVLVATGRGPTRPVRLVASEDGAGLRIEAAAAAPRADDPGTRLSLEVCREHARRMGGELRLGAGAGCSVIADLPLAR